MRILSVMFSLLFELNVLDALGLYRLVFSVVVLKTNLNLYSVLSRSKTKRTLDFIKDHSCEDISKLPVHCLIYLLTTIYCEWM